MRIALFCLLLLLTIGCSTFAVGQQAHYGAQESQQKAKTSERQTGQRQISGASHPRNGSVLPNARRYASSWHDAYLPDTRLNHCARPKGTYAWERTDQRGTVNRNLGSISGHPNGLSHILLFSHHMFSTMLSNFYLTLYRDKD